MDPCKSANNYFGFSLGVTLISAFIFLTMADIVWFYWSKHVQLFASQCKIISVIKWFSRIPFTNRDFVHSLGWRKIGHAMDTKYSIIRFYWKWARLRCSSWDAKSCYERNRDIKRITRSSREYKLARKVCSVWLRFEQLHF